jgi:hypothetical protein
MGPDAAQLAAVRTISPQIARKMGAGFEAADLGVWRDPRVWPVFWNQVR